MEAGSALLVVGICGLAGVLVDVDHGLALFLWRYVFPGITEGRIWHSYLFALSGIALLFVGAYFGGLYPELVLMSFVVIFTTSIVLMASPYVVWRW